MESSPVGSPKSSSVNEIKTRIKMTDEEYWQMKRTKNREKIKDNKRKYATKVEERLKMTDIHFQEEYVGSEDWKKNQEKQKRRRKWRDTDKEDIEFNKPEIVIDLSYSDVMSDKVFLVHPFYLLSGPR